MNPYVIDRSKLNLYIFFAVLLIIISFVSGYFLAQYRAGLVFSGLGSVSEIKSESEQPGIAVDESETLSKQSDTEAGLNADSSVIDAKQVEPASPVSVKPVTQNPRAKPQPITQTKAEIHKPATQAIAKVTSPDSDLASTPEASDQFKYSVQAGLFGNLANANKFLYQLQMAGFDGYMDEHQGDDGVIRYNVRFGRFASRAEAEQRLAVYRQGFSTPAYVIINP